MTRDELKKIIELHQKWQNGDPDGEYADLSDCDLSDCVLRDCDLTGAELIGGNLSGCVMSDAK